MFDSDNSCPLHPEVLAAYSRAASTRTGLAKYGQDDLRQELSRVIGDMLGKEAFAIPVETGTAGNILGLKTLAGGMEGEILCTDICHVGKHEGMALETIARLRPKMLNRKILSGEGIEEYLTGKSAVDAFHGPKTLGVLISQADELGRAYDKREISDIASCAKENGLFVFMDGARLANAGSPSSYAMKNIDGVCIGGSKNGADTDALVFFDKTHEQTCLDFLKSTGHKPARMFLKSAQLLAYFEDHLWLDNAQHANAMATLMRDCLGLRTDGESTNAVFLDISRPTVQALKERGYDTYQWESGRHRLTSAWDVEAEQVMDAASIIVEHESAFENPDERARTVFEEGGNDHLSYYDMGCPLGS